MQEGIDAATNTIIDYLCSSTLSDSIKIKGLIQLIATMDDFEGAKQRRQAKTKKYLQHMHRLNEQENKLNVSPFASKDKIAKTYKTLFTARKLQAYL